LLESLRKVFASDRFVPSTSVFPDVDVQHIAAKLNVEKRASRNAARNLPDSASTTMDSVELEIVAEVGRARRQGLENFEINLDVYNERLARATEARREVGIVAGKAKGDFMSDIVSLETRLANPEENVQQCYEFLMDFRKKHRLIRAAEERSSTARWVALVMLMLLFESVLNGYLFAQKNELGLLGGAMAAVLISLANVGLSSILGYYSRFINSVKFLSKLWGLILTLAWIGMVAAFNLAVAHFRDAVQIIGDWSVAANTATETLIEAPLGIASIESWLLIVLGCLISLLAFMKAYYADDPYPRYGKYVRMLIDARMEYTDVLNDALGILEVRRDDAIGELKEADQFVNQELSEAIDAVSGRSTLQSHLGNFLQLCELSVRQLLKQYRDHNRARRESDAPKYFDEEFEFEEFTNRRGGAQQQGETLKEQKRITEIVDKACQDIHQDYMDAVANFKSTRDLQNALKTRSEDRGDTSSSLG